jgi:serine/threonine-protein kinase PknG
VDGTGYCDRCGLVPLAAPTVQVSRTSVISRAGPVSESTTRLGTTQAAALPVLADPAPDSLVWHDPVVPPHARFCGRESCRQPVGRDGQVTGFCTSCGARYSFAPGLRPGDRLGFDRYEVVGPIGHGGVGWVYLAKDTDLEHRLVVLKGLINAESAVSVQAAVDERRFLIELEHPNIVRALDFVTAIDPRTGRPAGYTVMEYAGGASLRQIIQQASRGEYDLPIEDVIAYGLEILKALGYLHGRGLLYCDLKPENVMHGGDRARLIDLGAVCKQNEPTAGRWGTQDYSVPVAERKYRGVTWDSDLYTVGRTLLALFGASQDNPVWQRESPIGTGVAAFQKVLARATDARWHHRFRSAAEMAEQLTGVRREIRALRGDTLNPRPSTLFAPGVELFDRGLGTVPPLSVWTSAPADDEGLRPDELATDCPAPADVAVGLPDSRTEPDDPAATELAAVSATNADRLIAELAELPRTVEVRLWRCRAHLALPDYAEATEDLAEAEEIEHEAWAKQQPADATGEQAAFLARYGIRVPGWRLTWHRALLALADPVGHGGVAAAEEHFRQVRDMLPGELAPVLALGFCAEHRGDLTTARSHYDVVCGVDRNQASAAFGLARIHIAHGDRLGAVAALDRVPRLSRHYDAARIAAVRVLVGVLRSGSRPDAAHLADAANRLERLHLDDGEPTGSARDRLTTALFQAALDRAATGEPYGTPVRWTASHPMFGSPVTVGGLRDRLESSFGQLARHATDDNQHGTLKDLANTARRRTLT